jgi:molybdate transport system substrate-binding protein
MKARRLTAVGLVALTAVSAPALDIVAAKGTPGPKPNVKLKGLAVVGAASLTDLFKTMAPNVHYSFAGSDQLAFQIEQGAVADVFASASAKYPDRLFANGLVEKPVVFTYNRLVVIVPKANPARITSVADLTRPGVKLVIGDANVPVGAYTRTVFDRLGLNGALANVVSNEPDVRGVVSKVALGEADAGVSYVTDLYRQRAKMTAIAIDPRAQPTVAYEVAVIKSGKHRDKALAFIQYLQSPEGKAFLSRFGFVPA